MPYLTRTTKIVQDWITKNLGETRSVEVLSVTDDGDPEGGVIVDARLHLGGDFLDWSGSSTLVEWASRDLPSKLQFWASSGGRQPQIKVENDTTLRITFGFLPVVDLNEFIDLALRTLPPYTDDVISVDFKGDALEIMRMSNRNPTTMVLGQGRGVCIRHHGEHVYIIKHLLKVALGE